MSYPRNLRSRDFKTALRSSGDLTLTSAAFAAVDTGLDLTLAAQVGDVIRYEPSLLWAVQANGGAAFLDVGTVVSAAVVNRFSNNSQGWGGWYSQSTLKPVSGPAWYTLVAGDISANTVTLRLLYAIGSPSPSRVMYASVASGMFVNVLAANIGPVDPN